MATITLQFQTPQEFSRFKKKVKGDIISSDIRELTITINHTTELSEIAVKNMNARIIKS